MPENPYDSATPIDPNNPYDVAAVKKGTPLTIPTPPPSILPSVANWLGDRAKELGHAGLVLGEGFSLPYEAGQSWVDRGAHAVGLTTDQQYQEATRQRDRRLQMMQEDAGPGFGGKFIQGAGHAMALTPMILAPGGQAGPAPLTTTAAAGEIPLQTSAVPGGAGYVRSILDAIGKGGFEGLKFGGAQGATTPQQGGPTVAGTINNATSGAISGGFTGAVLGGTVAAGTPIVRGALNVMKGWGGDLGAWANSKIGADVFPTGPATPTNVKGVLPSTKYNATNGPAIASDLQTQYAMDRSEGSAAFDAIRKNTNDTLSEKPLLDAIAAKKAELGSTVSADKGKALDILTDLETQIKNSGPDTWSKALDTGTYINDKIAEALYGQNPNRNLARILGDIKDAHGQMLDQAGGKFGELYAQAKKIWIDKVVPWEDPVQGARFLQKYMDNPTTNDGMKAFTLMGPDKARIFLRQMSPSGRQALQGGVAQSVLQDALDPMSGEIDPARAAIAINRRDALVEGAFTGQEAAKWQGFKNLMQYASKFQQLIPGQKLGILPSEVAAKLFTTPTGESFLLGMGSLNPTSKAFSTAVATTLPRLLSGTVADQTRTTVTAPVTGAYNGIMSRFPDPTVLGVPHP